MPKKKTAEAAPKKIPENREKTGQFIKGKTGNPGGRPKIPPEIKEAIKAATLPAVETLVKIMEATESSNSDRIKCAEILINKSLGKNYQAVPEEKENSEDKVEIIIDV